MTRAELAAIRARLDAATPGPWHWDEHPVPTLHGVGGSPDTYEYEAEVIEATHTGGCGCRAVCYLDLTIDRADAEFIAHARTDIEYLLGEVERLSGIIRAVDDACQPRTWKQDNWSVSGRQILHLIHPPPEPAAREPKPLNTGDWTPDRIWTEESIPEALRTAPATKLDRLRCVLAVHPVTEYGMTRCPVEHVAAEIDSDGDCSACGAKVRGDEVQP